jgi:hypothetical protein
MNKKGYAMILNIIIEILVVLAFSVGVMTVSNSLAKSETSSRIIMANEMVMMAHTLAALPGDAVVEYPGNISQYTFVMEQEKLSILVKGENKYQTLVRTFNLPKGYTSSGNLEQKKRLCLEKNSKTIRLRGCKQDEQ